MMLQLEINTQINLVFLNRVKKHVSASKYEVWRRVLIIYDILNSIILCADSVPTYSSGSAFGFNEFSIPQIECSISLSIFLFKRKASSLLLSLKRTIEGVVFTFISAAKPKFFL